MLTRSTSAWPGAEGDDRGGRIPSRSSAASCGPAGTGEHDLLDSGPPRKRASAMEMEGVTAEVMARFDSSGVAPGDGKSIAGASSGRP